MVFGWFKKGPRFANEALGDLALMLTQDENNPTYRRDLLDPVELDFSVDSLKAVDAYLQKLHESPPQDADLMRVVLRAGAYVGEVMRRAAPGKYNWMHYDEAAKHSDFVRNMQHGLGTTALLWRDDGACFPLGKVGKFIQNGSEDSVYHFARVMLEKDA